MRDRAHPLVVVALGGNAISPPRGELSFGVERRVIAAAVAELAELARAGNRLLVVHGNGPQVGRLLAAPDLGDPESIDVHVAQTQGELGYLVSEGLDEALGGDVAVAVITRVLVDPRDPAFALPTKPVGAVLAVPPDGVPSMRMPDGRGWRRVVASPRPRAVVESAAVETLLRRYHVVAGGGGGVALGAADGGARRPQAAVVDKDYTAALLAVTLGAARLVFVTDVTHAFDRFGGDAEPRAIDAMDIVEAQARLEAGTFAPGSMRPKVESAVQFVAATGRPAVIATVGHLAAALRGEAGTTIGCG